MALKPPDWNVQDRVLGGDWSSRPRGWATGEARTPIVDASRGGVGTPIVHGGSAIPRLPTRDPGVSGTRDLGIPGRSTEQALQSALTAAQKLGEPGEQGVLTPSAPLVAAGDASPIGGGFGGVAIQPTGSGVVPKTTRLGSTKPTSSAGGGLALLALAALLLLT